MRIFLVHPGPSFSTADVYDGLKVGLEANGCEVVEGRLDQALAFQTALYEAGQQAGVVLPGRINIPYFASPYMLQHAIASEPDAVIVVSAHNFSIVSAHALRKASLRTAVLMTESPYFAAFERTMAAPYDVVFTNEKRCATGAYFDHKNVHYLPHAYNPAVHTADGPAAEPCDVFFCGSLFHERAKLFKAVDWSGIRFLRRGYAPGQAEQDIVGNADTAAHYRAAKICLNHHRTTTEFGSGQHIADGSAYSLGPRAYEIPACGGFMLCDDSRAELREVYGDTVPTYRAGDADALSHQLRYWLSRDEARERLAAAQHEAVRPHSWTARAKQVLEAVIV